MYPTVPDDRPARLQEVKNRPDPAHTAGGGALSPGRRLPRFVRPRVEAGTALRRLCVVGVGAVGGHAAYQLARLGIAGLSLVDPGQFDHDNLLTQAILPADIGASKARLTAERCKSISPRTRVRFCEGTAEALDTLALAGADVVLLATDNLRAEAEVGQQCLHLGQPLIQASVHGDTLIAQVRLFRNREARAAQETREAHGAGEAKNTGAPRNTHESQATYETRNTDESGAGGAPSADGACPACGFTLAEWAHLHRETTFSCHGRADTAPRTTSPPTVSVGFLCSLAADMALMQLLRLAVGLGSELQDSMTEYCGYTQRIVETPLARNPNCPAEHVVWQREAGPRDLESATFRELTAAAGAEPTPDGLAGAGFLLDEFSFIESGVCPTHGKQRVERFVPPAHPGVRCRHCDTDLRIHPFRVHRPVPAEILVPLLDRPLRELSVEPPRWALLRRQDQAFLFHPTAATNGSRTPGER